MRLQFCSTLIGLCLATASTAQTIYLSNEIDVSGAGMGSFRPRVALLHDTIPVVSWSRSSPTEAIFFSKMNAGVFSTPLQVNLPNTHPMASYVDGPSMLIKDDTVYLAYMAHVVDEAIVVSRSFDGGNTFVDTNIVYTTINHHVEFPALTMLPSGRLVIAHQLQTGVGGPIFVVTSYSDDKGSTWSKTDTVSNIHPGQPCECCPLAITSQGDTVAIAYRNNENDIRDFYCSISYNAGESFTVGGPIDTTHWFTTTCPMSGVDLAIQNDSVIGVFTTRPGSLNQSKIGKCALADGELGQALFINPVNFGQNHPSISVSNDTTAIVWQENSTGNQDVFLSFSKGNNPLTTPLQITTSTGTQQTPHVKYHKGVFHIVWQDSQTGRVKYRKAGFSPFTGVVSHQAEESSIHVWPNPITNDFNVDGPDDVCGTLTNTTGKILSVFNSKTELRQQIAAAPCVYILKMGNSQSVRLVKL
jgi:hypothetical protein